MPQQLVPAQTYALSSTGPMMGRASGGHGRMHAPTLSGSPAASDVRLASAADPAATRSGFASTSEARAQSPPSRKRSPST